MTNKLRIALAQLNPTVGAIEANFELALLAFEKAKAKNVDIAVLLTAL